ncbi:MAG: phage protein GemA/Gp16 family protein [Octadecabacter sp.]
MTRALQQQIHVGCRQLGLDADARRDLQLATTGKASMRDMTERDLKLVIQRLKSDGFKITKSNRRPAAPRADLRYVHVLWRLLGEAGKLDKPGREGLNAFIRSRFEGKWESFPIDIDALRNANQINDVKHVSSWTPNTSTARGSIWRHQTVIAAVIHRGSCWLKRSPLCAAKFLTYPIHALNGAARRNLQGWNGPNFT